MEDWLGLKRGWLAAGVAGCGKSGWRVEGCPNSQACGTSQLSPGPVLTSWASVPSTAHQELASLDPRAPSGLLTLGSPRTVTSLRAGCTESRAPGRLPGTQCMRRNDLSDGVKESPAFPNPHPSRSWSNRDHTGTLWARGVRTQTPRLW